MLEFKLVLSPDVAANVNAESNMDSNNMEVDGDCDDNLVANADSNAKNNAVAANGDVADCNDNVNAIMNVAFNDNNDANLNTSSATASMHLSLLPLFLYHTLLQCVSVDIQLL